MAYRLEDEGMKYKCDTCGTDIYIDPAEERICNRCEIAREKNRRYEQLLRSGTDGQVHMVTEEFAC